MSSSASRSAADASSAVSARATTLRRRIAIHSSRYCSLEAFAVVFEMLLVGCEPAFAVHDVLWTADGFGGLANSFLANNGAHLMSPASRHSRRARRWRNFAHYERGAVRQRHRRPLHARLRLAAVVNSWRAETEHPGGLDTMSPRLSRCVDAGHSTGQRSLWQQRFGISAVRISGELARRWRTG